VEIPGVAYFQAPLEHREGLVEVPSTEVEQAKAGTGVDEAIGVSSRLSQLDGFCSRHHPRPKLTQLGEDPRQPGAGVYSRYDGSPEAPIA
jgi:hypothetical protein